jgi:quercetin dioxygenase-like cupin family protein
MKNLPYLVFLATLISAPFSLLAEDSVLKQQEHVFLRFNEGIPYTASENMNNQYLKLTTEQTRGAFTLNEDNMQPDIVIPYHKHHFHDETFIVTKGTIHYLVDGEVYVGTVGDVIFIPRHTPHTLEIRGDEPGSHIMVYTPGGYDLIKAAGAKITPEQKKDKAFMARFTLQSDFHVVE